MHPRAILVLARHDSFFKAGLFHARSFAALGSRVDVVCLSTSRAGLSTAQVSLLGLATAPQALRVEEICQRSFLERYDLVLLGLDGRPSRDFLQHLHALYTSAPTSRRPVVVSYYPGVIFRYHFEGMQSRMSSDLILLNSQHDEQLYASLLEGFGITTNNSLCTGLSYIGEQYTRHAAPDTIVFFGQPTVPPTLQERAYVVDRLIAIARRCPSLRVVLKPRHRPNESTLHHDRFHYEELLHRYASGDLPDNLVLSYEPVAQLLGRSVLALTVSSSAALEALVNDVPTRILTDFGIHENLGSHLFIGSGLFCTFDDIKENMPYLLSPGWQRSHMKLGVEGAAELVGTVGRLLDQRDALGELPVRAPRLMGRTKGFVDFANAQFGLGSFAEFTTASKSPLARRWRLQRLGARLRRIAAWFGRSR